MTIPGFVLKKAMSFYQRQNDRTPGDGCPYALLISVPGGRNGPRNKRENMNKVKLTVQICVVVIMFLLFSSFVLLLSNYASLRINGFDIDSHGNLYIGRLHRIEIYKDGVLKHSVNLPRYRAWSMDLTEEDNIAIAANSKVYIMDLSGEVLQEATDDQDETYIRLRKRNTVIGNDGKSYTRTSLIGRTKIVDATKNAIYQVPWTDVYVKIGFGSSLIGIFILAPFVKKLRNKKDMSN